MDDDVPEIDPALGLEHATDVLYGLRPEAFIGARDGAAKAAKAAGDRDLAAALTALRKPTVSAWLANLLVRDDPDLAERLTELGEGLRAAEASLDGQALRDLGVQRRQLVGSLVARARGLGAAQGHRAGDPVVQELDRTLTAALADSTAAEEILSGHLTGPREHVGFGAARPQLSVVPDAGTTTAERPAEEPPPPTARRPRAVEAGPAKDERVALARAAAQDADRELDAARRALTSRQEHQRRAERDLERAEAEHATRRDDRAQAQHDAEQRRRELAAAQAAADRAGKRLDEAEEAEQQAVAAVTAGKDARADAVRDVRSARAAVAEAERAAAAAHKAVTAVEKSAKPR